MMEEQQHSEKQHESARSSPGSHKDFEEGHSAMGPPRPPHTPQNQQQNQNQQHHAHHHPHHPHHPQP
eukprot:CAMPEP_0198297818 /NCGR_PEP_ID=MMETSP1449-20131203/38467_1 /TAXON_ID=420275 /ORGANISM="Attheya septentrionalis, Strain CCMP2084" /LENGTH=66 /DNA_ID=CAMNT_0043998899 /DNA_START=106 /DNA_END=302 /DNA_ORIENTATION=+